MRGAKWEAGRAKSKTCETETPSGARRGKCAELHSAKGDNAPEVQLRRRRHPASRREVNRPLRGFQDAATVRTLLIPGFTGAGFA